MVPRVCRGSITVATSLPLASKMSFAKLLVENHGKVAAVVFPVSVLAGFAYTMKTGGSPLADGKDWVQGRRLSLIHAP